MGLSDYAITYDIVYHALSIKKKHKSPTTLLCILLEKFTNEVYYIFALFILKGKLFNISNTFCIKFSSLSVQHVRVTIFIDQSQTKQHVFLFYYLYMFSKLSELKLGIRFNLCRISSIRTALYNFCGLFKYLKPLIQNFGLFNAFKTM